MCALVSSYITHEPQATSFKTLSRTEQSWSVTIGSVGVDSTTLDHCICGIGFLLSECLKHNVNPFDFSSAIEEAQLSEEAKTVLTQFYDHIVRCSGKEFLVEHHHEEGRSLC